MKRVLHIITGIFIFLFAVISTITAPFTFSAKAEVTQIEYSSPLEDLQKSDDFDKTAYPIKSNDYSLSVITVAESENLQLFVYVYQPSYGAKSLIASSINISRTINNNLAFANYKLGLLGQDGVFQKYVVNDLIVNSDSTRNYQISSIFRVWDSTIDKGLEPTNENTIDEVSFKVGKIFTFELKSGKDILSVSDVETISITSKYVGFVRYEATFNGLMGLTNYYDSHFVAFSTDKKIEKLYEADVYYQYQEYTYNKTGFITYSDEFTTPEEKCAYLTDTQQGSYIDNNLFWKTEYSWYRISTVEDFIANENRTYLHQAGILNVKTRTRITDEGVEDLKEKEWVLRFAETNYNESITTDWVRYKYAVVGDVSVLRLLFETDGVVYNLGVIDNKQTGDNIPDNETEVTIDYTEKFEKIMALLLGVALLAFIMPFLAPIISSLFMFILKGVLNIIKIALKIVIFIITLPLRPILWLFNKK